jgi:hypothetical protein
MFCDLLHIALADSPELFRGKCPGFPRWLLWNVRRDALFLRIPGFSQDPQPLHVLANRGGLLLDIGHRTRALFARQTLPVGARNAFRRRDCVFSAGHTTSAVRNTTSPLNRTIERAALPFQYIRGMAKMPC